MFAAADEARRDADADYGEDDFDENGDPCSYFSHIPETKEPSALVHGRATCHPLADGDFHLCFGARCKHAVIDGERQLVCTLTGMVVGLEFARDHDPSWTGRSTGSANPDDSAGTPVGGWVRRRDMYAASVSAYRNAHSISDAEIILPTTAAATMKSGADEEGSGGAGGTDNNGAGGSNGGGGGSGGGHGGGNGSASRPAPPIKRGALCVDEMPDEIATAKRQRTARREVWSRDAMEKLSQEAMGVIAALMIVEVPPAPRKSSAAAAEAAASAASAASAAMPPPPPPPPPKMDPRLQNPEFVRNLALRKYMRACETGAQKLNLDVLHNVCIHANAFVRAQRDTAREVAQSEKQTAAAQAQAVQAVAQTAHAAHAAQTAQATPQSRNVRRRGPGFSGQIRQLIANLTVSLWRAACATPHMNNKKNTDSFRPFAAGILYLLKRGVYLADGTCVVPALEALSRHLPALRAPQSTATAKQLQSSSHRGICSFQRSISSMETMDTAEVVEVRRLFQDAAGQAAYLRALVHKDLAAAAAAAAASPPPPP